MSKIRIGIIGAGFSGVVACKACLEEGFNVVVYEKSNTTGGLWRYRDQNEEGVASVAKSTVKYFDLYGKTFGFERCVRFRHEVIRVEPNTDYDETGKWIITVRDQKSGQTIQDVVNGVMICTGHHGEPSVPIFKQQDKFKGQIIHSNSYKKPEMFLDKKVVIVGIGNSGADTAVELSTFAEKVYLSTRRGSWIFQRVGPNGIPFDVYFLSRIYNLIMTYMPFSLICSFFEYQLNSKFNHEKYQLKPKHRALSQHPTINESLPNKILSGTIIVKQNIEKFTENGVIFEGETEETLCDVVILATGYKVTFPFLSQSLMRTENNEVLLYKYMFSPQLKHLKTLAFISLIQPLGSIIPIGEMQSRWFTQLMANKSKLPNYQTIIKDINRQKQIRNRYYKSERHTLQVDWINFMDELAELLGVKPNLFKYFLTDPKLWWALLFGPLVPYQYRLEGPHQWSGARDAILSVNERILAPLKTRDVQMKENKGNIEQSLVTILKAIIVLILIAFLLNYFF